MSAASLSSWSRRCCKVPNLRAPTGFRRVGGDMLDAGEGRARPGSGCPCPPCRRPRACGSSGCRCRASGTARARRPPREAPGKGAFLGDEEGRFAGGVVHGDAHGRSGTHSWREPSWCSAGGSARHGCLRRWAARLACGHGLATSAGRSCAGRHGSVPWVRRLLSQSLSLFRPPPPPWSGSVLNRVHGPDIPTC